MIHYHNIKQGSDEWLRLRKELVTASNAVKLINRQNFNNSGVQGYKSPAMLRGNDLEPIARNIYEAIKNKGVDEKDWIKVDEVGFITNDDYPNAGYSPDGLFEDGCIEIKCFNEKKHLAITKDSIPIEVQAQVQFGMMIAELDWCDLVLFNPDVKEAIKIIRVPADEAIQENIKNKLKELL